MKTKPQLQAGKSKRGNFFAVGKQQWDAVCKLGMNPAVAFLVLARGTGADNATTAWSAQAVFEYTEIAWRRAKVTIETLCDEGLVTCTASGKRPRYKLVKPESMDDLIWLPNEIITGAADEVPPIKRIRQTQEIEVLQLFVELYGEHELTADGGLPRTLLYEHFERKKILDMSQYTVYGFDEPDHRYCRFTGPLARFEGRREEGEPTVWDRIKVLEQLGLLERIYYLAESTDDDAELIHPLSGDEWAQKVADAAHELAENRLPYQYEHEAQNYDYVLPVIRHMGKAAVVGLARLRYRPKTSRTAAWWGQHVESCRAATELYSAIANRDSIRAVG
ncbi:MAG: hypothetical protein WD468_05460 [Pirellulales bacterium]